MSLRHTISRRLKSFEKDFKTLNCLEISRSALLHNFDFYSQLAPNFHSIPVLKANAYGHGLTTVAEILKARSFPYIAVDGYFEALSVQQVSKQPVLVMGAIDPTNFQNIHCERFSFVVHDESTITALGRTRKGVKIHLEIETGMARHGVQLAHLPALLTVLKKYPKLQLEGVMTHLADASNPKEISYSMLQAQRFDEAIEMIREAGFTPQLFHIAQSAGSVKVHSKYANAFRYGIGLYGVSPLDQADPYYKQLLPLQPVLRLTSTITKVVELATGETVGYGRTFTAEQPSRIGVIPLGYYEGLPRKLSNCGIVTTKMLQLPVVGRVCMNHTMIDLTGTDLGVGTAVTIISPVSSDPNSVCAIYESHGIYRHELLTGLNQNLRRVIIP